MDAIISDAIKKVCAQYVTNVPPERLMNLKNEFKLTRVFMFHKISPVAPRIQKVMSHK